MGRLLPDDRPRSIEIALTLVDAASLSCSYAAPWPVKSVPTLALQSTDPVRRNDPRWSVIGDAWCDSENIHQLTYDWLDLWRKPSRRKRTAMNRADRDTWKALPAKLTIYRGVNCDDEFDAEDAALTGLSWTLSRKKAVWFARRGSSQPYVAKGTIFKRHCFAYFSDRNEQEIVVDPDWTNFFLMKVRRQEVSAGNAP